MYSREAAMKVKTNVLTAATVPKSLLYNSFYTILPFNFQGNQHQILQIYNM